jgi:hypothetical protein
VSDQYIPWQYRWKVRELFAIVEYAVAHGLKTAPARFDLDRKTVRSWRDVGAIVQRLFQAPPGIGVG